MNSQNPQYPVGTLGQPWGEREKQQWLDRQRAQRSYQVDVISQIDALASHFDVESYGELDYTHLNAAAADAARYPVFVLRQTDENPDNPYVLVTGGVHGYETSGVHGALAFAREQASHFSADFNLVIAPCLSPWGYETINRWNPLAVDPNRSFKANSQAQEAALLMAYLEQQGIDFLAHIDLHETTDTDNSEFRPALAAREGTVNDNWNIPDGFYLVADSERPQAEFQRAIIQKVAAVTHIAEPDEQGKLIGADMVDQGVIEYAAKPLGLCMGLTNAQFVTTTEVYPDSPRSTPEICAQAQVASVVGALEFLR
ncbi:MAG: peptidase [Idiomarina sp.]|nr:peptidase [Idiomarina sp.]